jgi:hypothetical protein
MEPTLARSLFIRKKWLWAPFLGLYAILVAFACVEPKHTPGLAAVSVLCTWGAFAKDETLRPD